MYLAFYIIKNWLALSLSFACLIVVVRMHFVLFSSMQRHGAAAIVAAVTITITTNEYINRMRKKESENERERERR